MTIRRAVDHHNVMTAIEEDMKVVSVMDDINPRLVFLGMSTDGRTNRWKFFCDCGYSFQPNTTLYATQVLDCDKCHARWMVNYNTLEIVRVGG